MLATGKFEVDLQPLEVFAEGKNGIGLGRMSIEKSYTGDLAGTGRGEMLTATTQITDSAGYVALEQVDGSLHGKRGSFVLQHSGTMDRGTNHLVLMVVPDSGTGQLANLSGKMEILVEGSEHHYRFYYFFE